MNNPVPVIMTDEQLADAVDEMFNSPDFDRIKFEAARRLRESSTKLAEVEREREGAREACGRYRKNQEGLTYQLSKAHDENKALRAERDNACADLEKLRVAAQMALDELHGYADAGGSSKADHICEALRKSILSARSCQEGKRDGKA